MSIRQALGALALAASMMGASAAPLTLSETLAAARANLDVQAAGHALDAARADLLAADHAPLPQLSAKLSQMDLQNGLGAGNWLTAKRIDKSVGLDWTWERGDKRALRTQAAQRSAGAGEADLADTRQRQALAALAAFYDLLAAQLRDAEVQAIEASAVQLAETAERRRSAGDLALQDAARAAIEAERAHADADAARLDHQRARLALATLIGREADALQLAVQGDWPEDDTAPAQPDPESLVERRADVQAAAQRVQAAEAALAAAEAQRQSDITWGASVDHYPGTSTRLLELRLQMPLAWGYHYEGETGRARAMLEQARDLLDKTRRAALADLLALRAQMQGAAQRARRYQAEIVPRSREVAQRAELAYRKGALPLTDLLDARRTLRSVLVDAIGARADLAKAAGAWQLRTTTE